MSRLSRDSAAGRSSHGDSHYDFDDEGNFLFKVRKSKANASNGKFRSRLQPEELKDGEYKYVVTDLEELVLFVEPDDIFYEPDEYGDKDLPKNYNHEELARRSYGSDYEEELGIELKVHSAGYCFIENKKLKRWDVNSGHFKPHLDLGALCDDGQPKYPNEVEIIMNAFEDRGISTDGAEFQLLPELATGVGAKRAFFTSR